MIAIGSDHGGYRLKEEIKKYLDEKEIKYKDLGCMEEESVDYPNIAKAVAKEVQNKKAEKGILICRSGLGMSICANKFKGIRCTPCHNEYSLFRVCPISFIFKILSSKHSKEYIFLTLLPKARTNFSTLSPI